MPRSEQAAHDAAVEADVAAHLARSLGTPAGRDARNQLLARLKRQPQLPAAASAPAPPAAPHQPSTHARQQQGAPSGQQQRQQQQGGLFGGLRWPWQGEHPKAPAVAGAAAAAPGSSQRAQDVAAGDAAAARGQFLPKGHPALDPDVGFKTRGLKEHEKQAAGRLVDYLMAKALVEQEEEQRKQGGA